MLRFDNTVFCYELNMGESLLIEVVIKTMVSYYTEPGCFGIDVVYTREAKHFHNDG